MQPLNRHTCILGHCISQYPMKNQNLGPCANLTTGGTLQPQMSLCIDPSPRVVWSSSNMFPSQVVAVLTSSLIHCTQCLDTVIEETYQHDPRPVQEFQRLSVPQRDSGDWSEMVATSGFGGITCSLV